MKIENTLFLPFFWRNFCKLSLQLLFFVQNQKKFFFKNFKGILKNKPQPIFDKVFLRFKMDFKNWEYPFLHFFEDFKNSNFSQNCQTLWYSTILGVIVRIYRNFWRQKFQKNCGEFFFHNWLHIPKQSFFFEKKTFFYKKIIFSTKHFVFEKLKKTFSKKNKLGEKNFFFGFFFFFKKN